MKRTIIVSILVLTVLFCQSQTIKTYTKKDGNGTQEMYYDCKQDGSGKIWFGGNRGLSKWDGSKFTLIEVKDTKYGIQLFLDKQKNLLILNSKNVLSKVRDNQVIEIGKFTQCSFSSDGTVWAIKDNSLFRYDGNLVEKMCSDDNSTVSTSFSDSKGNLWIASGKSIYRFKDKDYVQFADKDGVDGSSVSNFLEDSKGRIWVTSRNSGIFCYNNDKWVVYEKKDGIYSNDVLDLVEDNKGIIWAAHYRAGISYYDGLVWSGGKKGSGYYLNNPLEDNPNLFFPIIYIDNIGNLWFGCIGGDLQKFNGTDWENQLHINAGSQLLTIYNSKNDVWIKSVTVGMYKGIGLNKYDLTTNKLTKVSNENVYQTLGSNNGVIWFYTDKGMYKYDDINGYQEVIPHKAGFGWNVIHKFMLVDELGNVWAGYKDGIYCISAKP